MKADRSGNRKTEQKKNKKTQNNKVEAQRQKLRKEGGVLMQKKKNQHKKTLKGKVEHGDAVMFPSPCAMEFGCVDERAFDS